MFKSIIERIMFLISAIVDLFKYIFSTPDVIIKIILLILAVINILVNRISWKYIPKKLARKYLIFIVGIVSAILILVLFYIPQKEKFYSDKIVKTSDENSDLKKLMKTQKEILDSLSNQISLNNRIIMEKNKTICTYYFLDKEIQKIISDIKYDPFLKNEFSKLNYKNDYYQLQLFYKFYLLPKFGENNAMRYDKYLFSLISTGVKSNLLSNSIQSFYNWDDEMLYFCDLVKKHSEFDNGYEPFQTNDIALVISEDETIRNNYGLFPIITSHFTTRRSFYNYFTYKLRGIIETQKNLCCQSELRKMVFNFNM